MNAITEHILNAHGGLDTWKRFSRLRARLSQGGALWTIKGQAGVLDHVNVEVSLTEQWVSHSPFGEPGRYSVFKPDHVTLHSADGSLLEDLPQPRASFAGHTLETPWSQVQLAYFAGCAMWTYLNMPFVLVLEGVKAEEVGTWKESGHTWRRVRVEFPHTIATHSSVQMLYIDDEGLIRRHDYDVEIAGNTPGAHYVDDYVEVQGLKFPTRRRIFPRTPDGTSLPEPLVVSIDLSSIELT